VLAGLSVLHMAQLMLLSLTVSCFSKIQTGFTFLVPAHLCSPGKGPLDRCMGVCVCVWAVNWLACVRRITGIFRRISSHASVREMSLTVMSRGEYPLRWKSKPTAMY